MPTHAPTGSIRETLLRTPIFARDPGSRAHHHDLDEPFGDLGHFEGEQPHHQFRRGSAHEQLGPAHLRAHIPQIAAEPVSRARDLPRNDFFPVHDRLGVPAEVEDDAAPFQTLDDAGHHLAHPVPVRLDDLRALGFADLLDNDLFGGLGGDPAEHH